MSNCKYFRLAAVFLAVSAFFLGCSGSDGKKGMNSGQLVPAVEAVQAGFGSLPLSERLTGVVKSENQVEIYPKISAEIVEIFVRNGDVVVKGQSLVRMRDNEFSDRLKQAKAGYRIAAAQARQAEAALFEAKNELKRNETLAEKDLVSISRLEAVQAIYVHAEAGLELAKARLEQAQANVEELEEAMSETLVRSSVSGTVGNMDAELGMLTRTTQKLFTIGRLDKVKIEVVLTDKMLGYIFKGHRAEIITENDTVQAELVRVSPFLNPKTHSTVGEIEAENIRGYMNPGMFVTVDVFYGESEKATLIPLSALYENPVTGTTGVYVCREALNVEPKGLSVNGNIVLSDPVPFDFVPAEIVAKGRLEAGVKGIEPGSWIVTLGQNLIGGDSGTARVNAVNRDWVEHLQKLQTHNLLESVMTDVPGQSLEKPE